MTTGFAGPRPRAADVDEIQRFLSLITAPGSVVELRALGVPKAKVVAGYFDNHGRLVEEAARLSGQVDGVYVTLNQIPSDLLARAANRVVPGLSPLTADSDIVRRTHVLVDCDPPRRAGISSTDGEHAAALERAGHIRAVLTAEGFPLPLLGDSGNGGHLIYAVDLPNSPTSTSLVQGFLHGLNLRFGDDTVKIDCSTFNAARITKLFGTRAAKGDPTPERPHRLAHILDAPDGLVPVPVHLLERLAALADAATPPGSGNRSSGADGTFGANLPDIEEWLARHDLAVVRSAPYAGGRKYILAVCPWNPEHTNESAFVIQFPNSARAAGCLHDSCRDKRWQDLRRLYEPEYDSDRRRHDETAGTSGTSFSGSGFRSPTWTDRPWPSPPDPIIYRGLAGEIVDVVMPHSEADPIGVLINTLTAAGNVVGDGPHMLVGATRHTAREHAVLVGPTGKGRKGETWTPVHALLRHVDQEWAAERIASGLSSGEGLIHEVRDPVEKQEPIKEKGKIVGYQSVLADEGVDDKRLLVIEPEFARPLRVMGRQGNTLESVLRDAWDRGELRVMTRKDPLRATGAHISLVGHITVDELRRELADVSIANGFANRNLWVCVRRSKFLPEPVPFLGGPVQRLGSRLSEAVLAARSIGRMERDPAARAIWQDLYPVLSRDREGLAGALLARAEAHVLRLSLIYALLDGSPLVTADHLLAALALWEYVEASVAYIFGDATGDPTADAILVALRQNGELTRTQISDLFARNVSSDRIARALQGLLAVGKARTTQRATGGRPVEVWMPA